MNKTNVYLDQVLFKIRITPERKEHIKNVVKSIDKNLKKRSKQYNGYRFGGGFKRYTSIKNYFDVDIYFIGSYSKKNLLSFFLRNLQTLESKYKPFKIARTPPYLHAIPATFNKDVELDCLAAIDLGDGLYEIPEANKTILIKPKLDEERLKDLNINSNGLGTKVIRLLKLWNSLNKKPFKSYQLEAIIYEIFEDESLLTLDEGIYTFFQNCIKLLQEGFQIYDAVDKHPILIKLNRKNAINLIQNSIRLIKDGKWTKLFPTI